MLFKTFSCIIILVLILLNIRYKIQIKNIYDQVDFIKEHKTNKIITSSGSSKSINKLIDLLNEFILLQKKITRDYKIKDDALKEIVTNISHDIRTPLTSLNGYFQLLNKSDSEEERKKYMSIIDNRINNLKDLLEDMFTYMKIQDGKYNLEVEKCNISRIVQENLFSYYEDFKLREIEPILNIPDYDIFLHSNKLALDRIISNLINNSLIHGISYIGVSLYKEKNIIYILVENNLKNPEYIDTNKIFTRFYKNDKARTLNSSGLGLSIVKELVDSIGGKVKANIDKDIFRVSIELIL